MWSLFSRDPAASFPYEIGDIVQPKEERSIFTLHYAKKKACGSPVSAFVCLGAVHSNAELELARTAVRRIKVLKHPCMLDYVDSLESEKAVYLITNPVSPLLSWLLDSQLSEQHKECVASWGLQQVMRAVDFLNTDGGLEHCNICSPSVFVTPGGEWKLFGVEFCRPTTDSSQQHFPPPNRLPPSLAVYDAPEKTNDRCRNDMTSWSGDAWGLGCLMWEVFTGAPLMQSGALRNTTKLPSQLLPVYKTLLQERPSQRPQAGAVLKQLCQKGGLLDNDLIRTVDFLDNIHIKLDTEKNRFFADLTDRLDNIPDFVVKNKILPATLFAHQFSNVGSVVLGPLFKMSRLLSEPEYQAQVLPCVVRLFSSSDRPTRLHLLQQMQDLIIHMDPNTVNEKVFPELSTGFLDTNPVIRENTVRSILYLAPKLNKQNLNIEILKHFARLQSKDDQGGIRTNCTVCLGKIACHLTPATRQKCLISAFTRALRDPFPPARVAGVMALAATQHYYPVDQVASRILPALCGLLLDPEKNVRDAVFRVFKGFLGKLEKLSEDPSLREEMEREVSAASAGAAGALGVASGWAGWAVGTLTNKFYKSSINTVASGNSSSGAVGTMDTKTPAFRDSAGAHALTERSPQRQNGGAAEQVNSLLSNPKTRLGHLDTDELGKDGWGDDDNDEWKPLEDAPVLSASASGSASGWEDAEEAWDDIEQIVTDSTKPPYSAGNSGGDVSKAFNAEPFGSISGGLFKGNTSANANTVGGMSSSWSSRSSSAGVTKLSSTSRWMDDSSANPDSDDFFASLNTSKSGNTVKGASAAAVDEWGSGWDDGLAHSKEGTTSSSSELKDAREQRRLERQHQIEAKRAARGPMKLGVKKT